VRASAEEQVIVVSTSDLRRAGLRDGFDPCPAPILAAVFAPGASRPMARARAEADPSYKQIICYVVLMCQGRLFHYRRSARATEHRLAGLRSLGVGGHLNVTDDGEVASPAGLERAIRRELAEEVVLDEVPPIEYLGIINDDSTPVGQVHVGLVAAARLTRPAVRLRDAALVDGRFDPPVSLLGRAAEFETWSQLCLPALVNLLGTS
jgi:predicted NUDIX family phosphoesterase